MKYVLDTHALIWFLEGNLKLGANAKGILCDPNSQLVIPATTLAEAVWIQRDKLPANDSKLSLTWTMIEAFRNNEV